MHEADWKSLGQVAGGVLAYAILAKVFDFVRAMRTSPKCDSLDDQLKEIRSKLDKTLRIVTRISDKIGFGGE